ncbi:hypothetical protein OFY17_01015 [Marinomonas sp. C2222]|uniref:Type II secretion system protein GspC N-terminal domain-containing protein n=1 Tax=Marinomonas sargassi TaxID=2984494 RepID=A0ABT2YNI2_9GAMM|nr:type II secretion system protein N [Marinomonas sargassi]MCV2401451.1 hypothetical protein [Marinomonas sargassi]
MKLALLKVSIFTIAVGAGSYYVAIDSITPSAPVAAHEPDKKTKRTTHNHTASGNLFGRQSQSHQLMEETSLNISLQGVMTSSIPEQAMAILLIDGREERTVLVSEEFASGVTLSEVRDEFVVIERNGQLEKLSFSSQEEVIFESDTTPSQSIAKTFSALETNHIGQ